MNHHTSCHYPVLVCLPGSTGVDRARVQAALPQRLEHHTVAPHRNPLPATPAQWGGMDRLHDAGISGVKAMATWSDVRGAIQEAWPQSRVRQHDYPHLDDQAGAYTLTQPSHPTWRQWRIGGDWHGHFISGDSFDEVIRNCTNGCVCNNLYCDGGRIGGFDLWLTRELAAREAAEQHQHWRQLTHGLPPAQPWRHFLAQATKSESDLARARTAYENQPRVAVATVGRFALYQADPIDIFDCDREQFIARAAAMAVPGYAHIGLDGVWDAPTTSDDSTDVVASIDSYLTRINSYLDRIPASTIVVMVDCQT